MRNPIRVLAVAGVLSAVVLAALGLRGSFQMPLRTATAEAPAGGEDLGGNVVQRALELAQPDSVRLKRGWVDDIPDLELAVLEAPAREAFLRIANGRDCDCGCGYTLAGCRRYDSTCDVSGPRARALYDSVRAGRITRADEYPERPAAR